MRAWLKKKILPYLTGAAAWGVAVTVGSIRLFGVPSDPSGWVLPFLIGSLPIVLFALGDALLDAARNKALSQIPAQGGVYTRTPRGVVFTAFEDLSSLALDENIKPVRRELVAVSREGRELSRHRLVTAEQTLASGAARDAFRAWQSARSALPPGVEAACARGGRELRTWLADAADVLTAKESSGPYRVPQFDRAALLEVLGSMRTPIEVRAAVAYTLIVQNEADTDAQVRKALGAPPPPLVCAAVELARPGQSFVSQSDMALARACLAPAELNALELRPHVRVETTPERVRLRVEEGASESMEVVESGAELSRRAGVGRDATQ